MTNWDRAGWHQRNFRIRDSKPLAPIGDLVYCFCYVDQTPSPNNEPEDYLYSARMAHEIRPATLEEWECSAHSDHGLLRCPVTPKELERLQCVGEPLYELNFPPLQDLKLWLSFHDWIDLAFPIPRIHFPQWSQSLWDQFQRETK